jgi:hypothetical protein
VSKLAKIQRKGESNSKQDVKADDLRQMFLAMTNEVTSNNYDLFWCTVYVATFSQKKKNRKLL